MDKLLRNAFKQQIEARTGFDFEDFIDELFLLKYGDNNYVPIRKSGDRGNDGTILIEQKVLACYAPRKYSKDEFKAKVLGTKKEEGDFVKYQKNWKNQYPNWEMYVNHEVSPDQFLLIQDLEGSTSIKGIDQILSIVDGLASSKIRKLAAFIGAEDFFKQDYIEDILNDLLNSSSYQDSPLRYNRRNLIDIKDKISLNFSEEDIDGMNTEIILVMTDFHIIDSLLSGYEDEEKNILKWRIIDDFNRLSGVFKDKLNNLNTQYTRQYGNIEDDEYRKCVKTVLLYMFEQCLIGRKTDSEP